MLHQAELSNLIVRAQGDDREALDALITTISPLVYKFSLRMCRSDEDAQDIAQETLISVFRNAKGFRGDASPLSWIYSIARNACIKKYRRRKDEPSTLDSLADVGDRASEGSNRHERAADTHTDLKRTECALGRILSDLDEALKEAFILREIEGLSAEETASVLGISVPALKSRLHRARKTIQSELERSMQPGTPKASVDLVLSCKQLRDGASLSETVQAHICERIRACLLL